MAHGAIPVRDGVGNHLPRKLLRELHGLPQELASLFRFVSGHRNRGMPRVQSATNTASPAHPLTPIPVFPFSHNGVSNRLVCPDPRPHLGHETLQTGSSPHCLLRQSGLAADHSNQAPMPLPETQSIQYATSPRFVRGEATKLDSRPHHSRPQKSGQTCCSTHHAPKLPAPTDAPKQLATQPPHRARPFGLEALPRPPM